MATYSNQATLYDYIVNEDLTTGYHTLILTANNENVQVSAEVCVYNSNIEYAINPVLGDNIPDTAMLILIYKGDLSINTGAIITPQVRKKGMTIYCKGTLTNNGKISMTARGAKVVGQNVYIYRNGDGSFEYIPAIGALGISGSAPNVVTSNLVDGNNGISRKTGGGGRGAVCANGLGGSNSSYLGASSAGTSYSGGSGSGAVSVNNHIGVSIAGSAINGGLGGIGYGVDQGAGNSAYYCGGGAGNTGGVSSVYGVSGGEFKGMDNTGGLLIVYAANIVNNGAIESNGSNGAGANISFSKTYNGFYGGSGSGAGSINLVYTNTITGSGSVTAQGGLGGLFTGTGNMNMGNYRGGNGGNGSITVKQAIFDSINILSVLPTHTYDRQHNNCLIDVNVIDQATNEKIKYALSINSCDFDILSTIQQRSIQLSALSLGSNTIKIKTENNTAKNFTIIREPAYRTEVFRSFLNYDDGYIKNNVTFNGSAVVKATYASNVNMTDNNRFFIELDKYMDNIGVI